MNELELIRDQLIGVRAQVECALRNVNELLERMAEPEPPTKPRGRYLGDDEPAPEGTDG